MKLDIRDEISPLKYVIIGSSNAVPIGSNYSTNDPEFNKYVSERWDKKLLVHQHSKFLEILKKHNVKLLFAKEDSVLPWQMWTRDIGFVCYNKFFYCRNRKFKERTGEINNILHHFKSIPSTNIVEITEGYIEGGDILVDKDIVLVGMGSRTDENTIRVVEKHFPVKKLNLGDEVMHLDSRMTLLPNNYALICVETFNKNDLDYLKNRYKFIQVTKEEAQDMGTNVLVINPTTVIVHEKHKRIQKELINRGFSIEIANYSEPLKLKGSFRCATLPIQREY